MRRFIAPTALGLLILSADFTPLAAQSASAAPPVPAARPEDVGSVDAIIGALYHVISGPAGQKRDWDRFRSLFAPGARLMPTGRDQAGKGRMTVWSAEDYIKTAGGGLETSGFFEREIGRTVAQYGKIVQAFSAYDSRRLAADEKPFARGINSIQLFDDGTRWWIVTVLWEQDSAANPIPAKYLTP